VLSGLVHGQYLVAVSLEVTTHHHRSKFSCNHSIVLISSLFFLTFSPQGSGMAGSGLDPTAPSTPKTGPIMTPKAILCWRRHLSFECADVQYDHIRDLQSDLLSSNHTLIIFEFYRNLKPLYCLLLTKKRKRNYVRM
jgi:hypothetical protein